MEFNDILNVNDELNIYLVANGIKPATTISLYPTNSQLEELIVKKERRFLWRKSTEIYFKDEVLDEFEQMLYKFNLSYVSSTKGRNSETYQKISFLKIKTNITFSIDYQVQVGKDEKNLEKLLSAKDNEETGISLGFPVEAVESYLKIIDGERRDGTYLAVSFAKAKQAGLELPSWLAYLSYIPEQLDIVNNKISSSSKELGEKYQNFVRKNNPELAKRVETFFSNLKFPNSWEKAEDYGYYLKYD